MFKLIKLRQYEFQKNRDWELLLFDKAIIQVVNHKNKNLVSLFEASFEDAIFNRINKMFIKDYDYIFIIRTVGLGEANLLNFMIKSMKLKSDRIAFVSHREVYKDLFTLYNDYDFYLFDLPHDDYAWYLKNNYYFYKKKHFFIHHCTIYQSRDWLKTFNSDKHITEFIKEYNKIDSYEKVFPSFNTTIKNSCYEKIFQLNLDVDNFIFINPESNGTQNLPDIFWKNLSNKFIELGYDVFVNTQSGKSTFGRSCLLSISEAAYLASKAKKVISLRCGFCELLAAIKEREKLVVIYNSFLKKFDANIFMEKYTLKRYPFVNMNIDEYIYDNFEIDKLVSKIIGEN